VTASIDGREIMPRDGETILAAAERLGIAIPTLCHTPGLAPDGSCSRCVVEIAGRRSSAACHAAGRWRAHHDR
jgi:NADH dehydrogenase/NADH:ubiquinone oxidoreductase subunit G